MYVYCVCSERFTANNREVGQDDRGLSIIMSTCALALLPVVLLWLHLIICQPVSPSARTGWMREKVAAPQPPTKVHPL